MKKLLLVALTCFLLACVYTDSGVVVSGVLLDVNGRPLVGEKVEVSNNSLYTNEDGYFCFEGMHPVRDIKIAVKRENYKSIEKVLNHNNYELKIVLAHVSENAESELVSRILPKEVAYDWYCNGKSNL